jgi:hypothetical protein
VFPASSSQTLEKCTWGLLTFMFKGGFTFFFHVTLFITTVAIQNNLARCMEYSSCPRFDLDGFPFYSKTRLTGDVYTWTLSGSCKYVTNLLFLGSILAIWTYVQVWYLAFRANVYREKNVQISGMTYQPVIYMLLISYSSELLDWWWIRHLILVTISIFTK